MFVKWLLVCYFWILMMLAAVAKLESCYSKFEAKIEDICTNKKTKKYVMHQEKFCSAVFVWNQKALL